MSLLFINANSYTPQLTAKIINKEKLFFPVNKYIYTCIYICG